tara:strand:+ start:428 stop:856 length:429 start_codon:yes stop_codon:yes gene_type:complete
MFEKVNQIGMAVIMAIGVVLMVMTMGIEVSDEGECLNCGIEGTFIGLSYLLLGVAILAVLTGTVMTTISNPKKFIGSAIGIGAMIMIFVISYVLASDEVLRTYGDITASTSKMVGAGLFTFYILLVLAVLSIIYAGISRLIN